MYRFGSLLSLVSLMVLSGCTSVGGGGWNPDRPNNNGPSETYTPTTPYRPTQPWPQYVGLDPQSVATPEGRQSTWAAYLASFPTSDGAPTAQGKEGEVPILPVSQDQDPLQVAHGLRAEAVTILAENATALRFAIFGIHVAQAVDCEGKVIQRADAPPTEQQVWTPIVQQNLRLLATQLEKAEHCVELATTESDIHKGVRFAETAASEVLTLANQVQRNLYGSGPSIVELRGRFSSMLSGMNSSIVALRGHIGSIRVAIGPFDPTVIAAQQKKEKGEAVLNFVTGLAGNVTYASKNRFIQVAKNAPGGFVPGQAVVVQQAPVFFRPLPTEVVVQRSCVQRYTQVVSTGDLFHLGYASGRRSFSLTAINP